MGIGAGYEDGIVRLMKSLLIPCFYHCLVLFLFLFCFMFLLFTLLSCFRGFLYGMDKVLWARPQGTREQEPPRVMNTSDCLDLGVGLAGISRSI